ncbi:hypothetical protein Tco_0210320, partial [Tanacetum coccineum]
NTMAEQNVPAQPPTRTDEQIVPRSQCNTNFFQAFTASANVPAIYLQQFWKTMSYNEKTGVYSCQVDEQWFDLSADLLRKALAITPVNPTHPFELPPSGDTVIDFVNELGYPEPVEIVSSIGDNYYLAIITTSSTSDSAVLHTGDDLYLWKSSSLSLRRVKNLLKKVQACKLTTKSVLHPKKSHNHHTSQTIQASSFSDKETFPSVSSTEVRKGIAQFTTCCEDDEGQKDIFSRRGNDPDLELAKKLSLETPQEKGEGEGDDADLERAIKLSLDPAFLPQGRAPVGGVTIRDPVSETTSKLHEVVAGKAVFILVRRDQTPPDSTTGPSSQPEDDTSEKVIHESSSTSDSERTESETDTAAPKGSGWTDLEPERRPSLDRPLGKLHVFCWIKPEHMDDEFLATAYPKVHENLKLITDERVIDDKPESHSGSMSSMKNLDDTFNFGDQFLHDKPTKDDQEKSKIREELIPPYDS